MNKLFLTILVLCQCTFFSLAQRKGADIKFDEDFYNFGNIIMENGKVTHVFNFTNNGDRPLIIQSAQPSCGCTAADYTRDSIAPGKRGFIRVSFDPKGKPGENSKFVTVISNSDPAVFNLIIKANVFLKNDRLKQYKYNYGNLVIINNIIPIRNTHPMDTTVFDIPMYNNGTKPIHIKKTYKGSNIIISPYINEIKPDEELVLRCAYTPKSPIFYGPQKQEIRFFTDDDSMAVKSFYIESDVFDNPKNFTKKQLRRSPKVVLNKYLHNFGDVYDTAKLTATFTVTNKGKDTLFIRRIVKPCDCITATSNKEFVLKNQQATITITYNPEFYVGVDERFIRLITNDIRHQDITLTLRAYVSPAR